MRLTTLYIATLAVAGSQAKPLGSHILATSSRQNEPCGEIRDQVAKWMVENGIAPQSNRSAYAQYIPSVPAAPIRPSLALACLNTVPLHAEAALQHLDFLRPLVEWQSTMDYLRDPPSGYLSEGVDLTRGLDDIAAGLKSGLYGNEFEFLADLYHLISVRPRDFHFAHLNLLLDLFTFRMTPEFLSVSADGHSTPEIYLYENVHCIDICPKPSPVQTIDGIPAAEFLERMAVEARGTHDPDARFNALLRSVATAANALYYDVEPFTLGVPDTTTVKLRNGTVREFINTAFVRANFSNIASGADLYDAFGQGIGTTPTPVRETWYRQQQMNYTTNFTHYPNPVAVDKLGQVAGFLPDGPGFSDVAVLSVNSFDGEAALADIGRMPDLTGIPEFASVAASVIRAAQAANRTKLILDVQGNSGGSAINLAILYFSLFPNQTDNQPYPILIQERAQPQLAFTTQQLFHDIPNHPIRWPMVFSKPDGSNWTSPADFSGPYPAPGPLGRGAYTHPAVPWWPVSTTQQPFRPPTNTPPFLPENILIISDGQCGSACALFVNALTHTHGVRTVALGGRPSTHGLPMQAVGQTRGGPNIPFAVFPDDASINRTAAAEEGVRLPPPPAGLQSQPWSPPSSAGLEYKPPVRIADDGKGWGAGVTFNAGNVAPLDSEFPGSGLGVAKGAEVLPLQFRYEAANCRLYFTWEMTRDITAVWEAAARAAWRGGRCLPGSTTNIDGTIGDVPGYRRGVEDRYQLGKGAGTV